jgi:hypothetical protein
MQVRTPGAGSRLPAALETNAIAAAALLPRTWRWRSTAGWGPAVALGANPCNPARLLATAAPLALGRTLEYVGRRYSKPETWISEFGTNIPGEDGWPANTVGLAAAAACVYMWMHCA